MTGPDDETVLSLPGRRRRRAGRHHRAAASTTPTLRARIGAAGRPAGRRAVELAALRRSSPSTSTGRCWPCPRTRPSCGDAAGSGRRTGLMLTVRYDRLGAASRATCCSTSGCGFGRHAFEAARRGARVVAFDYADSRAEGGAQHLRRHGRGRRGRRRRRWPARCRATPPACPSPTAPSTGSSPPRCSSTSPTTPARCESWPGCSGPAARMAVTVPGLAAREGLLGAVRRVPRAVRARAATCASTGSASCGAKLRGAGLRPGLRPPRPRAPLALLVAALRGRARPTTTTRRCAAYRQVLEWDIVKAPRVTRVDRAAAEPRPRQEPRRLRHGSRREPAVSRRDAPRPRRRPHGRRGAGHGRQHRRAAAPLRDDPVVPRRPLRPVEPRRDGHGASTSPACIDEAERAYEWLVAHAATGRLAGTTTTSADGVESRTPSSTPTSCAYVATGVWHHWLVTGDRGFVERLWPTVERRHRLGARPADPAGRDRLGPATSTARRGATPCSPARRRSATRCAARVAPGRAGRRRAPRLGAGRRQPRPR